MNTTNENKSILIIIYGELIHTFREKNFVHKKSGNYIDDDIIMWVSIQTAKLIAELENELFRLHGWTVRIFVNSNDYVVFM